MSATWVIEGLRVAADALVKTAATPEVLRIFLFSNNATITSATVKVDLTEIATSGGETQNLTRATWDAATNADPVVSRYNSTTGVAWSITGDLSIYGWAICGAVAGSNKIYCAENWGLKTVHNGDTVTIIPLDLKFDIV